MFTRENGVMNIVSIMLFLILIYILVSNFKGTTSIITATSKGIGPMITALQGVGPGYPAPAR